MNMTKAVYQLSGRQLLMLAVGSALIALGTAACFSNFGGLLAVKNSANTALAETGSTPIGISNPDSVSDEQNSIEVYKSISPGVVFITTSTKFGYYGEEQETESGNGSGSVIDAEGRILTNFHVIEGASKLTVSFGGDKTYPAKVVGGDPDTDLAIIKIEPGADKLTVVQLGDSEALQVGQKVLAIGNPFGLDRTLTTGVISGLQRPIRARNGRPIEGAIQTDASINPGNSGGPLLDKFGRMIGINSQILSRSGGSVGVGFAIPVSIAKRVIPQLIQFGEVRRPKLGATLFPIEQLRDQGISAPVESGLLIRSVVTGGSAEKSGLRGFSRDAQGEMVFGDIITAIDGVKVGNMDDLYKVLDKKKIGDTVQIEVFRGDKTITLPVKLLALPASVQGRPRNE
jgi:S1-C subfamily serine protease